VRNQQERHVAQRVITVNDGYYSTNDLTIGATFVNGRIQKAGGGALQLTGATTTSKLQQNVNNTQVITVTLTATNTGFTLTYNSQTTGTIAGTNTLLPTASAVQTALEGLSNIGPGNVAVTGVPGGPFTVIFQGALSGIDLTAISGARAFAIALVSMWSAAFEEQ
jgi:hypothetical protein